MRKNFAYFLFTQVNNQNMKKKMFAIFILISIVAIGALFLPKQNNNIDYLRLHIRANSNSQIDQDIKYEIKNILVEYLAPYFSNVSSKQEAINLVEQHKTNIEGICDSMLELNGFNYVSNVKVNNEYFPTRTYSNTTLQSGYYDAVIVELGESKGDNWWCVMYPPLCFVNKNESNMQINYKSKILEWLENLFG